MVNVPYLTQFQRQLLVSTIEDKIEQIDSQGSFDQVSREMMEVKSEMLKELFLIRDVIVNATDLISIRKNKHGK